VIRLSTYVIKAFTPNKHILDQYKEVLKIALITAELYTLFLSVCWEATIETLDIIVVFFNLSDMVV
jgi:hypothetical protein